MVSRSDIRKAIWAFFAVTILLVSPTVSAMVPPACCLDGGMLNDPQIETEQHSEHHCAEKMAHAANEPDSEPTSEPSDTCTSNCTGSCCSIYLSVGMVLPNTSLPTDTFETAYVRPFNVAVTSFSGRFPTPPPRT